jgi:nucleotide-binding universal stress UspA family protein
MTHSLVVLTDFFAVSNRALSYAAGLAMPLQAQLVLLHVRSNELLAPHAFAGRHSRQGEQTTAHALQQLAQEQPVLTEVEISEDALPTALQESIRRHHPLLVVVGRSGAAGAADDLVTRTAMDLLRHTPFPLLVVPAVGWDAFPPRRLLLAVDGLPFNLFEHQDVVSRLLFATRASLDVVVVTEDGEAAPDATAVLETIRHNDLGDTLTEGQVHTVYHQAAGGGVLQEAARQEADLLVVVARHHSVLGGLFHRSVTAELIQSSPIPVLLLPAEG